MEFTQRRDELARRGLQAPLCLLELGPELLIGRALITATHLAPRSARRGDGLCQKRYPKKTVRLLKDESWTMLDEVFLAR